MAWSAFVPIMYQNYVLAKESKNTFVKGWRELLGK